MSNVSIFAPLTSTPLQTVSTYNNLKQFEIHQFEDIRNGSSLFSDRGVRNTRYEIIWVKKGVAIMEADGRLYPMQNNMIYCMAPGSIRKFLERENLLEGYYISFCHDFFHSWQGFKGNSSVDFFMDPFHVLYVPVPESINVELENIAHSMRREFANNFNQKIELLRGLLNIFVIYFSRSIVQKETTSNYTREHLLFKDFIRLVNKNFTSMKMVSDYANLLCVTPNYLNKTVKKLSGKTASYHIHQQIITEAINQVVYYRSSLKEIAYQFGFDNLAHFSKFFKSNSGTSFRSFKKGI